MRKLFGFIWKFAKDWIGQFGPFTLAAVLCFLFYTTFLNNLEDKVMARSISDTTNVSVQDLITGVENAINIVPEATVVEPDLEVGNEPIDTMRQMKISVVKIREIAAEIEQTPSTIRQIMDFFGGGLLGFFGLVVVTIMWFVKRRFPDIEFFGPGKAVINDPDELTGILEKRAQAINELNTPRRVKRFCNKVRFQYHFLSRSKMLNKIRFQEYFDILLALEVMEEQEGGWKQLLSSPTENFMSEFLKLVETAKGNGLTYEAYKTILDHLTCSDAFTYEKVHELNRNMVV